MEINESKERNLGCLPVVGVGTINIIQIVFALLRVFNVINWHWCLVFLPTILFCGLSFITMFIIWLITKPIKKQK